MENFVINNPTVLHFGKNVISKLPAIAKLYGKKALLVIGQGSVIKNGIYDEVISLLKKANIEIIEYNGIKPNPVYNDVDIAAKIAKEEKVDFIIAVGGGSVIDSAKMISITTFVENSVWDFYENKIKPLKALPLIAVLTIAATGTEMNCFAVLQNNETLQKEGYAHPLIYPKHSFLDPQYTFSVPLAQTSYGIVDLIAHCLEYFFGEGDSPMSDKIAIATIAEAIECAPTLLSDLYNYELRARIMYAATIALNGWN
ncbi:MAG TPA: iron-containing alcohol dehydrogenase, partial [Bacteroidales bacterium]|nr:iron-containing alcohol dehydrogenase [Bacteroidales bacterium]